MPKSTLLSSERLVHAAGDDDFVWDKASELYNMLPKIYSNKSNKLEENKKKNMAIKNRPGSFNL